jgi:hypothetical protein
MIAIGEGLIISWVFLLMMIMIALLAWPVEVPALLGTSRSQDDAEEVTEKGPDIVLLSSIFNKQRAGYAGPHLGIVRDSVPFNILLMSDLIRDGAITYDLTLKWGNSVFEEVSKDILTGQPHDADLNSTDNEGDNSDNGYACETNLAPFLCS